MKRIIVVVLSALLTGLMLRAQEADSLRLPAAVDSTLVGKDILSVMGSGVKVNQSKTVRAAFDRYVRANAAKPLSGYRIRVFYDNGQDARSRSEGVAAYVRTNYPDVAVYRSFESPNYKVSVGDFRTKEEALRIYNRLKALYPAAFIIKENINYPR